MCVHTNQRENACPVKETCARADQLGSFFCISDGGIGIWIVSVITFLPKRLSFALKFIQTPRNVDPLGLRHFAGRAPRLQTMQLVAGNAVARVYPLNCSPDFAELLLNGVRMGEGALVSSAAYR